MEVNEKQFKEFFGEVMIHPEYLPVPEGSYVENRQQYRARPFLQVLGELVPRSNHALGLVDLDLFVPELNFIFGSAQLGGNAIIALPRLRQSFYGLPDDDDLFFQRTVKEVFHELGHVMGLQHCTNDCVMQFSNSLIDTDNKPAKYCPACVLKLK
jgi:archaemetzincin